MAKARAAACFALSIAIAGCGGPPLVLAEGLPPAVEPQIPRTLAAADLTEAETADIQNLFDETRRILLTPAFARNLVAVGAELPRIRVSPFGRTIPAADLARLVQGQRAGYVYVPGRARWSPGDTSTTGSGEGGASLRIRESARCQWRSADPDLRSYAINTAAHELSHTITASAPRLDFTIADRGFSIARIFGRHFASYTIGSVARCTWLEEQGAMAGGLIACVGRSGTDAFKGRSCPDPRLRPPSTPAP